MTNTYQNETDFATELNELIDHTRKTASLAAGPRFRKDLALMASHLSDLQIQFGIGQRLAATADRLVDNAEVNA